MLSSTPIALLALFPLVNAQSTVDLFLPGFGEGLTPLLASIKGSDSTATTYVITCASGASTTQASATPTSLNDSSSNTDDEDEGLCHIGTKALTLTQGPSTVILPYTLDQITATIDCVLDGTTSATCTATQTGANDYMTAQGNTDTESVPSEIKTTLGGDDVSFVPVTITAGAAKDVATASATDAGATANPAAGNTVQSSIPTRTVLTSVTPTSTSTSASTGGAGPTAAGSTGGAGALDASYAFGGVVALGAGLMAALL